MLCCPWRGTRRHSKMLRIFSCPYRSGSRTLPQKTCIIHVTNGMIMRYTVVLEPQEEGGFTVQCVEIPGAISQGETREEALANIKDAIELVLEVQWKEVRRQASTVRHEISKVDVADVA